MINSEKVTLGVEIWGERDFFIISFSTISTYIYYHISCIHITFKNYALQKIKLKTTDKESEKVGLNLNIQKTKIMASGPITSWQIDGKQWKQCQTLLFWDPKSLQMVTAAMKLKEAYSLEGKL